MRRLATPTAVLVLVALTTGAVRAAAPVVESGSPVDQDRAEPSRRSQTRSEVMTPPGPRRSAQSASGGEQSVASRLFVQIQQLQQEVMELRGRLEEQQHALDRMKREQRERYLDLDRRLSNLTKSSASAGNSGIAGDGAHANPGGGAANAMGGASEDESAAYEAAFELMRSKRYEKAINAFEAFIERYPDGDYVPNAYYWLGELYLAAREPQLEQARQAFVQVLELYPEHRKVPDALYKLGVVYEQLGESDESRKYLERVQTQYPDSSAAKLAHKFLDQREEES